MAENVFVGGEETLLSTDREGDDRTDERDGQPSTFRQRSNSDNVAHLPMVGDVWFDCGDEA